MNTQGFLTSLCSSNQPAGDPNFNYEAYLRGYLNPNYEYAHVGINSYAYERYVNNTYGSAVRIGLSDNNSTSASLSCRADKYAFNHLVGIGIGRTKTQKSRYPVYLYYESNAITREEAAKEITFIRNLVPQLSNQVSMVCSREHISGPGVDNTILFVKFTNQGRTSRLTADQRSEIVNQFTHSGFQEYRFGIHIRFDLYKTLSIQNNPKYWIIYTDDGSVPHGGMTPIIDAVSNLMGIQKGTTNVNGASGTVPISYWKSGGVSGIYRLPQFHFDEDRFDRLRIPDMANQQKAWQAYRYPFNDKVQFRINSRSYRYYSSDQTDMELIEGFHYNVAYAGVRWLPITGVNPYPNMCLATVIYNLEGIGLFNNSTAEVRIDGLLIGGYNFPYSDYAIEDYVGTEYQDYAWTGSPVKPNIVLKSFTNNFYNLEDFVITGYENNVEVGTGYVIVAAKYSGPSARSMAGNRSYARIPFNIKGEDITKHTVTINPTSAYYTGNPITPTVTVSGLPSSYYTVTYSNNVNPGTGVVTVTGKYPNTGTVVRTFTITKEPISHFPVTVTPNEFTFDGYPKTDITVSVAGVSSSDYTYTISNNRDVGYAVVTVTATAQSKYAGSTTGKFKIVEANVDDLDIEFEFDEVNGNMFTGYEIIPKIKFLNMGPISAETDYEVEFLDNVNVSSETNNPRAHIKGKGNLVGEVEVPFEIISRDISSVVYGYSTPSGNPDYNYEAGKSIYYAPSELNIYHLNYPEDIVVEEATSEWIDNPYRPYFDFYQKYIGVGNFNGSAEYRDHIAFDPSDPGTFDYGLEDLYGTWSGAASRVKPDDSEWDFGFQESDYKLIPDPESKVIGIFDMNKETHDDRYRYDFNVLSGDPDNPYEAGREFILEKDTPVYVEAYSILPFDHREGSYIVYDSLIVNNRIKMTDSTGNVNKAGKLVCWVNVSDLNKIGIITVGDKVMVNGKLYRDTSGGGGYVEKFDEVMYVVKVVDITENEYPYGLATSSTSEVIGYAEANSIEEIAD